MKSSSAAKVWGCVTDYTAHCVNKGDVMITLRSEESSEIDSFLSRHDFCPKFLMSNKVISHNTREVSPRPPLITSCISTCTYF